MNYSTIMRKEHFIIINVLLTRVTKCPIGNLLNGSPNNDYIGKTLVCINIAILAQTILFIDVLLFNILI